VVAGRAIGSSATGRLHHRERRFAAIGRALARILL
jgi:hypothetical protein